MTAELYADASLYSRIFPLDEEEIDFWRHLTASNRSTDLDVLVDIGAGPSPLGALLNHAVAVALDPCAALLASSPVSQRAQGDAGALPIQSARVQTIISRLFGLAYAAADDPTTRLPTLTGELRRVLAPGGVAALEIPVSPFPRRMQGIEESAELWPGCEYRFRYFEIVRQHPFGATLETEITVEDGATHWAMAAPLFVFTPDGARGWAALAGLTDVRFFASYDLATETLDPPNDALRGVLVGRRTALR